MKSIHEKRLSSSGNSVTSDFPVFPLNRSCFEGWRQRSHQNHPGIPIVKRFIHMKPNDSNWSVEWPTLGLIVMCYAVWIAGLSLYPVLGWPALLMVMVATAFHSSLQHEALHGHPTRSRGFNEVLVTWGIALWLPYRRYRSLHLTHHNDINITDPHDDPESWYCDSVQWQRYHSVRKYLLTINRTLAGRLALGPFLVLWGFWFSEVRLMMDGERRVQKAWLIHLVSTLPVLMLLAAFQVPVLTYLLVVVVPSISVVLLRSYIEHRAELTIEHRTGIIEAGRFWSFMFLNNNLHALHHRYPHLAWYILPRIWREEKEAVLDGNGGYYLADGYAEVASKWMFKPREPVVHPYK